MPKYHVRKYYCYYLEAEIEASSAKEAENIFDETDTEHLNEEYLGNIQSGEFHDTIELSLDTLK